MPMAAANGPTVPNTPMPTDREELPLTIDLDSLSEEQLRQCIFVDVREDTERMIKPCNELAHEHFPLSRFQPSDGFPAAPEKQYIFFCAKGQRSLMLAEYLREQGMNNACSLDGGIDAIKKHFQNQ